MSPRILLLGGHGRVSLYLTPLLLARNWQVISVIRDPSQKDEILALGNGKPGKVEVLLSSLEDVKSEKDAQKVIDEARPDWVVWSAGAAGKGGASRTYAIDRDAAKAYISASVATPSVEKFLMISYIGSRRHRAPWWSDEDYEAMQKVNNGALADYYKAKLAADEHLIKEARKRNDDFFDINLRPGTLRDEPGTGKVQIDKTKSRGDVTREDVARVAAKLLEKDGIRGWFDLLQGNDDIDAAVDKAVASGLNTYEGEEQ